MSEPSKITKVLIDKIHGGRKQDSKFWKSEFSDNVEPEARPSKRNAIQFVFYPLVILFLSMGGYLSYYFYNNFFASPDTIGKDDSIQYPEIKRNPPSSYKQRTVPKRPKKEYLNNSADNLVTKKELNNAIDKALRDRPFSIRSNNRSVELPYYRVELNSGSIIRAKSAVKDGDHFTIKDTHGVEFSMLRSDIKNVKKILP